MLSSAEHREPRNIDRRSQIDECRAKSGPRLLSLDRRRIAFRRRFGQTEQLLADLVSMFLEETVENDGICVIVGGPVPLVLLLLARYRVVLLQKAQTISALKFGDRSNHENSHSAR